ncbi:MAG TPA: hypothetical protein VFB62_20270, partial [Polyangiaceae bacterium]|nr:hypothetical protein [Polyangiaceae bacterium]
VWLVVLLPREALLEPPPLDASSPVDMVERAPHAPAAMTAANPQAKGRRRCMVYIADPTATAVN